MRCGIFQLFSVISAFALVERLVICITFEARVSVHKVKEKLIGLSLSVADPRRRGCEAARGAEGRGLMLRGHWGLRASREMTMTSVAVAPASLGAPPTMLTPKMYHLQQGLGPSSGSPSSSKVGIPRWERERERERERVVAEAAGWSKALQCRSSRHGSSPCQGKACFQSLNGSDYVTAAIRQRWDLAARGILSRGKVNTVARPGLAKSRLR